MTRPQEDPVPELDAAPALADPPPRSRGTIALVEQNCTCCMLCARECPDWCLYVESHDERVEPPGGGRPRTRHVLDRFAIDFGLCLYCGICVEVCPFDALFWSPEPTPPGAGPLDLLLERGALADAAAAVPPPPPLEAGAGDRGGAGEPA